MCGEQESLSYCDLAAHQNDLKWRAFADGHVISRHINGMNRMVYGFDFIPGTSVYVCHCWIVHQGSLVVNVRRRCDWKLLLKVNGSEYEMSRESPKTTWILYDFVVCKC